MTADRVLQSEISDVKEAFGVEAYWSMAGVICVEAKNKYGHLDHASFDPYSGIWERLVRSAREQQDLESWLS